MMVGGGRVFCTYTIEEIEEAVEFPNSDSCVVVEWPVRLEVLGEQDQQVPVCILKRHPAVIVFVLEYDTRGGDC